MVRLCYIQAHINERQCFVMIDIYIAFTPFVRGLRISDPMIERPGGERMKNKKRNKKRNKRLLTALLVLAMLIQSALGITVLAAEDDPVVGVYVANKVDVALAVGPTGVDYSTFEADLRARLAEKPHPIPNEDLYITAAMAVSANTTSEFQWWAYDHTRPATMASAKGTSYPYGGVRNVSDATHIYLENDLGNTTTSNNMGTINRTPGSVTYTPDPTNPDIGYTRHPYQGITNHMVESNSGATMDFYGYAHDSYKDFRYLPNDQKTKKVFEFAIQEDLAYDALDGVGFFFNTEIKGSYTAKTQTMSGYLLFLAYNSSGAGASINIYKFKDVNTYRFHQSMNSTTATATTAYTIANYTEGGGPKFVSVASSAVYKPTDKYRRIKLEVLPTYIRVYYNGSSGDSSVLTTPITEDATPISFTGSISGMQIPIDEDYVTGYGFGPMSSYISHTCARPTHLTLQNLSMIVDKVRTLPEVVREPDWHENTMKFLVNLNENEIEDFSSTSITAELLARLTTDDIYYIGWCTDINAQASEEFLLKHNLKGTVINIQEDETDTYNKQIQAIADEIYKRYWHDNEAEVVLVTDHVTLDVQPSSIKTDTADPEWPSGKWLVVHHPTDELGWDSGTEGLHPQSNVRMSDLEFQFNVPGQYDIYYRDALINSVKAHRAPVAQFSVDLTDTENPVFTNTSYDPDDLSENGLVAEDTKWTWIDITDTNMLTPLDGLPESILEDHIYLITLSVTDKLGATASVARQVSIASDDGGGGVVEKNPPFAYFTLTPTTIMKDVGNQRIVITNGSYDLYGAAITSNFVVTKDGEPYSGLVVTDSGTYNLSALPTGSYKVSLTVQSENGTSTTVARTFEIVADTIPPTASATPASGTTIGNTTIALSFGDTGGSGFHRQHVIVTDSTDEPEADAAWLSYSGVMTRNVNVNKASSNYIHWEAWDNAGNKGSGYFGPYVINKITTTLTLTASPETQQTYGAGTVTLTAALAVSTDPYDVGSRIFFYEDDAFIGAADLIPGGEAGAYTATATLTVTPEAAGNVTYRAVFNGDSIHSHCEGTLGYAILQASGAAIEAGLLADRQYNGDPYPAVSFAATYPHSGGDLSEQYSVTYSGTGDTVYGPSDTPPTGVGSYIATGITTDPNYEQESASAGFAITPRPLAITLSTSVESGESQTGDDVILTATITNAIELPPGKIVFYVDGNAIAEVAVSGGTVTTDAWKNVLAGDHDLKAEYVPAAQDNYGTGEGTIDAFSVDKSNQSGFGFIEGAEITKTYGDAAFSVTANGGESTGGITYALISGTDAVSFDPATRTVSIVGAGEAIVRATKAGDDYYNAITADITITVGKANHVLAASVSDVPFGQEVQPTVTNNVSGGVLSYSYQGRLGTAYGPSAAKPTAIGTYTVTITSATTLNYNAASTTVDFSIIPCDCTIDSVSFDGAAIEIDHYQLQKAHGLSSDVSFSGCGFHDEVFEVTYELVGTPEGVTLIDDGTAARIVVNERAVGSTIPVKVTYTHTPTGVSKSAVADFTVTKGAAEDSATTSHNKNTGSDRVVDISSFPDGDIEISYNGTPLTEGDDYTVEDGNIIFSHDFLNSLPVGESTVKVTIDGTEHELYIDVEKGALNIAVVVSEGVPSVSTPSDLNSMVVGSSDLDMLANGYNVNIELVISELQELSDADIISGQAMDRIVGLIVDISLRRWVGGKEDPEYIKELTDSLTIVIDLPQELRGHDQYWIARVHHPENGGSPKFDWIPAQVINNGTQLQFKTSLFSSVGILFKDTPKGKGGNGSKGGGQNGQAGRNGQAGAGNAQEDGSQPLTGDNSSGVIGLLVLLAVSMLVVIGWLIRNKRQNHKKS